MVSEFESSPFDRVQQGIESKWQELRDKPDQLLEELVQALALNNVMLEEDRSGREFGGYTKEEKLAASEQALIMGGVLQKALTEKLVVVQGEGLKHEVALVENKIRSERQS